jgi:predicted peptidase
MKRFHLGVALSLVASISFAALGQEAKPGSQQAAKLDKQVTKTVQANYLVYLPKDYGKDPTQKWPVILFLHGSGERGSDINKVKLHGPPKVAEKKNLPFVIISPQCPDGEWWKSEVVITLLDDVIEKYSVDPDRVYLTGLSMGGFGTWQTAIDYPDRFAAIAPICGGGNRFLANRLKNVPTWVFHGQKDQAVPFAASVEMAQALKQSGGDVRFTAYPEAGHDSWTVTYDNPQLYEWFLSHKRGEHAPAANPAAGKPGQ